MESEDFKEWLVKNYLEYRDPLDIMEEWFRQLPFEMKWGVYLKYFDEKGLEISVFQYEVVEIVHPRGFGDNTWCFMILKRGDFEFDRTDIETRLEAQQEAVKKAFELISK